MRCPIFESAGNSMGEDTIMSDQPKKCLKIARRIMEGSLSHSISADRDLPSSRKITMETEKIAIALMWLPCREIEKISAIIKEIEGF